MSSGSSVVPVLSQSVVPAGNDAGRELLDNLEVSGEPQLIPQEAERLKQGLQTKFTDESLIFALHRFIRIQESRPTLQQYSHFINQYEDEITDENTNLRIEKESDKRCLGALLKELAQLNADKKKMSKEIKKLKAVNTKNTMKMMSVMMRMFFEWGTEL